MFCVQLFFFTYHLLIHGSLSVVRAIADEFSIANPIPTSSEINCNREICPNMAMDLWFLLHSSYWWQGLNLTKFNLIIQLSYSCDCLCHTMPLVSCHTMPLVSRAPQFQKVCLGNKVRRNMDQDEPLRLGFRSFALKLMDNDSIKVFVFRDHWSSKNWKIEMGKDSFMILSGELY